MSAPDPPETTDPPRLNIELIEADSFEEVNANFKVVTDYIESLHREVIKHAEVTNANVEKLAEETSGKFENIRLVIQSILSSQTMMISICVIFVGLIFLAIKSGFELYRLFVIP